MFTKEDILKQLNGFKLAKGKPVIVHSSMKAVGDVDGGAEALLEVLIEFFTKDGGILCVPTHTWKDLVLDLRKNETCIGVLPKVASSFKGGIRTLHPTHSMAVFGEKDRVSEFVMNEAFVDSPTSPAGCYGNLFKMDGYVLLMGVDHTKNTYLHCVEEMLKVPNRLTEDMIKAYIIHKDGRKETRRLYWFDERIGDVSEKFGKFEPAFRIYGGVEDGFIGDAKVQLCSAKIMKKVMETIYNNAHGKELLADFEPLKEELYRLK